MHGRRGASIHRPWTRLHSCTLAGRWAQFRNRIDRLRIWSPPTHTRHSATYSWTLTGSGLLRSRGSLTDTENDGVVSELMTAMCAFRAVPRAAACGWLRSGVAVRTAAVASRARQFSSGEQFTVYHDANCAVCKSVVETLVSADAPYATMSFLKKSPKEDALLQVARVLEGGAELMLQDNSWPRVTDPKEVRACSIWRVTIIIHSDVCHCVADRECVRQQPWLDAAADRGRA
jgi:hypothetical protein